MACPRQSSCARGAAAIPHSWATLADFSHANGWDAERCGGFLEISFDRPAEGNGRRVFRNLSGER
jgi:hypothetical protein